MNWLTVFFPSDNTSSVLNTKKSKGKISLRANGNDCEVLFNKEWFHGIITGRFDSKKDAEIFLKNSEGKFFTCMFKATYRQIDEKNS